MSGKASKVQKKKRREGERAEANRPPLVSCCMIVKNEEKRLEACLKSVVPFVNELIVVDTGSTDSTKAIAKRYGAVLYDFPWTGSFSEARNFAISKARGKWVLSIDADEEIVGNGELIAQAVNREDLGDVGGYYFHLWNVLKDGSKTFILHPHLFRREGFHFTGKVHNKPEYEGQTAECPVQLHHYGYGEDDATMQAKHARRVEMIKRWTEEEPENFEAWFYWGQTLSCSSNAELEELEAVCAKALAMGRDQGRPSEHFARIYYNWLAGLFAHEKAEEILAVADEAMSVIPWYPDPMFFKSWAHMRLKQWQDCCYACADFFALQDAALNNAEIRTKFTGVENLTADRHGIVVAFWREATNAMRAGLEQERLLQCVGSDYKQVMERR